MIIPNLELTYLEFIAGVHKDIREGITGYPNLTEACVGLLEKVKPRLLAEALKRDDPREPPYPLGQFINFINHHWNDFDRQQKEFHNAAD